MSDTTIQADPAFIGGTPFGGTGGGYALSSDLAKLSLPAAYRDQYRVLAWVNSICFLFLLVGLIGLKTPRIVVRPLSQLQEIVPVVFTPPEEQPKPELQHTPDDPEPHE